MRVHTTRTRSALACTALIAGTVLVAPSGASAAPNNNNSSKLRQAVTLAGIQEHMLEFQEIADAHGGNRLAGTPGYDASADYVADRARAAGYDVELQEFQYTFTGSRTPAVLAEVGGASYAPDFEFYVPNSLTPEDSADVTAPLYAVDLLVPSTGGSTSGCEAADFAGFTAGAVALVQRGTCDFVVKIQNAIDAGASAVLIMNEGNAEDRMGLLNPATTGDLPVLATTFDVGVELANGVTNGVTGSEVRVRTDIISEEMTTRNVIAESRRGASDNVVVVGAHLDGVESGPGINDNGSGSATILEIAEQMTKVKPRNQVRFIWFSAEEAGLLGAEHYVSELSEAEVDDIAAMLNFDMLASPNFVRFVYDGDLSDTPAPPSGAPEGSAAIEEIFTDYFASQGLETEPTEFSGRSDYGPFIENGVPAGGLFTGAEGIKTEEQAEVYGGAAGEWYDPCYHAFCDSWATLVGTPPAIALFDPSSADALEGNGFIGLDQMADAAAHATITLAQNTESVNGRRGKGNFKPDPSETHERALRR